MIRDKSKGVLRDLTFKFNQFVSEEMDKKKANNNSEGEKINKKAQKK